MQINAMIKISEILPILDANLKCEIKMYSGFDPNTPSFPFFNSQCYCRSYFVIPFNVIAVYIIFIHIIIVHSYYPNVVFVCV